MNKMLLNNELRGIEIYFDNKPIQSIIDSLKENGYRWHNFKKCWYAKQSEKTIEIAQQYTEIAPVNNIIAIAPEQLQTASKTIKEKNDIKSLWDLTQWTEQNNVDSKLTTKEIAALIRKHAKDRFQMVKFSVTCRGYNSIDFDILSSPYEKDSIYLKAIQEYSTKLINSYCYCTCDDPYGDYGSSYNFYGRHADISYKYEQTEQTESIKADLIDFDSKKAEFEKAEEIRKEAEYQDYKKQQEEDHKNYLIRVEEEKKETELINNSVNVIDLDEQQQYFVIGSEFANLNKNSTLDQYKEEIAKGDCYKQTVKITKEVHFQNEESLNYFSNMLLHDFDFLEQTGGSFTDDSRINSTTDYYQMSKEDQQTVIFNLYGVAIYFNNKLQFVVDTQGFSYARYVGLTDNATISKHDTVKQLINKEELQILKIKADIITDISVETITEIDIVKTWSSDNWTEYKEAFKNKLKTNNIKLSKSIIQQLPEDLEQLKIAMYKLLTEVDGIQEQFKNADIQQGQKLTMFYISDWGSITTNRMTFESVENTKYAQYDNNVKITYTPQGKRTKYYNNFHSTLLVYNGWLELPKTVLHEVEIKNDMTITKTKYGSCDKQQYDEILNYFESQGIKPIINTYKPTF
jgi:hypothetical protein